MMRIQKKQDAGETVPDLYKMVKLFCNNWRLTNAQKAASHGAFAAAYQGKSLENLDDVKTDTKTDAKKKPCVCGEDHQFKDCSYLIESVRVKDWKPDPAIQKQIDEKLENASSRMKSAIK